jgi:D-glycero-D-manno-heptose 1,7-bisphosphate phosphatase
MAAGVILDRDGTLVDFVRDAEHGVVTPAFHPDQLRLLPGVLEGLQALTEAGLKLGIATNQPDAAKGRVPVEAIERTNRALVALLRDEGIPVSALESCLHHPDGAPGGPPSLIGPCSCRKPKPGMLLSIAEKWGRKPAELWMLGDTAADLGAAVAAGMPCALLLPVRRCELCSFTGEASSERRPDLTSDRFDLLADKLIAAEQDGVS